MVNQRRRLICCSKKDSDVLLLSELMPKAIARRAAVANRVQAIRLRSYDRSAIWKRCKQNLVQEEDNLLGSYEIQHKGLKDSDVFSSNQSYSIQSQFAGKAVGSNEAGLVRVESGYTLLVRQSHYCQEKDSGPQQIQDRVCIVVIEVCLATEQESNQGWTVQYLDRWVHPVYVCLTELLTDSRRRSQRQCGINIGLLTLVVREPKAEDAVCNIVL